MPFGIGSELKSHVNILYRSFMYVALLGFLASLAAHVAALMGVADPFELGPLRAGMYVVWLPAVLAARQLSSDPSEDNLWRETFRGCPPWMKMGLYVQLGYVVLSTVSFLLAKKPPVAPAFSLQGSSQIWMLFYFVTFATLYSVLQVSRQEAE
jgi:hypothetical protein